jgi:hypothetical protein
LTLFRPSLRGRPFFKVEDGRGCVAQVEVEVEVEVEGEGEDEDEDEDEVGDEEGVKLVRSKEQTMSGLPHSAPHFKRFLNSAFSTGRLFIIMDQIISSMMLS